MKNEKRPSDSTLRQRKDVDPATIHEKMVAGGSKGRDSEVTLVPDDELVERAPGETTCRDSSQTPHFNIQAGNNKTQHASPAPATHVSQAFNTEGRTASSRTPLPSTAQGAKTSLTYLPNQKTNAVELTCEEGRVHPLHTIRLERICTLCEHERQERLRLLYSSMGEIRIDPSRWRCKYPGDAKKKGDGNQRTGVGWSVAMGEWWDRGKRHDKDGVT